MAQWEKLLQAEGLRPEAGPDYICGVFDGDRLVATGCCCRTTLRCFAVDSEYQGQGLLNTVLTQLMDYQAQHDIYHIFLYTKPASARFFADLGFYEIDRAENSLVFMENRPNGFERYCAGLEKYRADGSSAAIVMNANPFTLGHRYLVERTAAMYDHVPYMISSATFPSYFLRDEREAIIRHAQLDARLFIRIGAALGISARCVGEEPSSLVTGIYNDVLAKCLPEAGIACVVIPRLELNGMAVSASTVRQLIHDGRLADIRPLVPQCTWDYFSSPEAQPVIARMIGENEVKHY